MGQGETRERARWHTGAGRFPAYAPTNKIRAQLRAGRGEINAVQNAANRLFRTGSELAPLPRKVERLEDVTFGLGLDNADAQRIQRLVSDQNAETTLKTQTQRLFLARGALLETLRTLRHIPSETRGEVVKRATAYWRRTVQTDYGRGPQIRYTARKSDADHGAAEGAVLGPRGEGEPSVGARSMITARKSSAPEMMHTLPLSTLLSKAKKGSQGAGHKYESRKPDGHGGWLYKYPGQAGWQAGKGAHEGTTNALPGEHLDSHHKGYKPTVEKKDGGGFTLHTGGGITSDFHPDMSTADHEAMWDRHKAGVDAARRSGDEELEHAHRHALQTHSRAHNMKLEAQQAEGQPGAAQGAAGPGAAPDGQPPGAAPGGAAPDAEQGDQPPPMGAATGQNGPPDGGEQGAAPMGAEEQQQPLEQPGQGESLAISGGRQRHSAVHPDIQAVQQGLSQATKVMSDIVASHAHQQEVKSRIAAVKGDKSLPRAMRKRLIAQHKAELAAAKLDQAMLDEHHDSVMSELKQAQKKLKKPHPILKKLIAIFAKLRGPGGPKDDADLHEQAQKIKEHSKRRSADEAHAEHQADEALMGGPAPDEPQGAAERADQTRQAGGVGDAQPMENEPAPATEQRAPGELPANPDEASQSDNAPAAKTENKTKSKRPAASRKKSAKKTAGTKAHVEAAAKKASAAVKAHDEAKRSGKGVGAAHDDMTDAQDAHRTADAHHTAKVDAVEHRAAQREHAKAHADPRSTKAQKDAATAKVKALGEKALNSAAKHAKHQAKTAKRPAARRGERLAASFAEHAQMALEELKKGYAEETARYVAPLSQNDAVQMHRAATRRSAPDPGAPDTHFGPLQHVVRL